MADSKEYISRIEAEGSINISEDVLSILTVEAIKEVEGVGGISSASGGKELLGKKNPFKGVKVVVEDDNVTIDAHILVVYGNPVNEVAKQVQTSVSKAVGDMTGLNIKAVNVHVSGVLFEKDK
ncbi:MAG: Asp23/Gls24 family envelope stress response protein [Clostridiales bacterium]|nr:Asp23/Gls24 family envelope stress response protein [Clostridiales bacterium]